ncbi:hypothetical protein H9Q72_012610 [Fusarium xylarioides]|uniref:Uncharacterized protein n=1 Tax=Fusarium xylarioides TaxID=221167 RepID=A0A9P7IRG5_9HYPO|nr:hypothetical protein H9Q70_012997 [Fusarium xylarioides]KAG5759264.1 hypothetical protein H9Q72_012610 [Fusarium xylarioides]KAG5770094.1 hypothetical protein H9Q73_013330 [Fusarium xylarioides]KAG5814974.1 hypothetical protein H9Q71_002963 [Fusarium xylarioides]KAG5818974.1 hypothetical protein H9Q74_009758 [Fusarium xylarioides]
MAMSKFVIALGLFMSTSALQMMKPKDLNGLKTSVSKACEKVLTAEVDCDEYIRDLTDPDEFRGETDEDMEMAPTICNKQCSDSFQSWYQKLTKECADEDFGSEYYPPNLFIYSGNVTSSGWNQTCAKDPKTGRFCGEILDEFSELKDDEEMPLEELCHPCYVKLIDMRSNSWAWPTPTNPAGDYWNKQLKLVKEKCNASGGPKKDSSSTDGKDSAEEETTSVTPHKTASADGSGVSTMPTASTSSTETAASKVAAQESNAGEVTASKRICSYWHTLLILGMGAIIL